MANIFPLDPSSEFITYNVEAFQGLANYFQFKRYVTKAKLQFGTSKGNQGLTVGSKSVVIVKKKIGVRTELFTLASGRDAKDEE